MPIKIASRFATAHDTAKVLGVSAHRADELVALVERSLRRLAMDSDRKAETRHRAKRREASRSVTRNDATSRAKAAKR